MYFYIKNFFLNSSQLNSFLLIYFCSISFNAIRAQGDLVVFPKRIVFESNSRIEQVNLVNIGKDSAVYNISFVDFRMTELGDFEKIIEPVLGQNFATPYLRVYPRQVKLAANESQIIKVQLINISKLQVGEYRSHLYFRAVKNLNTLGQKKIKENSTTLSVKIDPVFGISIPSIIRKGDSNTVVTISRLHYEDKNNLGFFINFDINRLGNMSVYGDITITYISSDKKSFEVAKIKGVGIYTPGILRKNEIALQKPKNINFKGGVFQIIYTENDSNTIIAENKLIL
jgi:hypothetical protein